MYVLRHANPRRCGPLRCRPLRCCPRLRIRRHDMIGNEERQTASEDREETREMVNATMAQLPPHYREALEAKYVSGQTVRDMAAARQIRTEFIPSFEVPKVIAADDVAGVGQGQVVEEFILAIERMIEIG